MGMVAVLRRVDDAIIAQLLKHPPLIHRILSDEEEADEEPVTPLGFLARLLGRKTPLPSITVEREAGDEVDLDKAWNAIHFMLTGAAFDIEHPLGFIFCGGETVGNEEVGYGPARAFSAAATQQIADAVSAISRQDFLNRFNAPAMLKAGVYPEPLWEPDRAAEHNEEYVAENFDSLRTFLTAAAKAKKGFLIFLT